MSEAHLSKTKTATVRRALREAVEFNFSRIHALAPLLDKEHAAEVRRRQRQIVNYQKTLKSLRRKRAA